MTGEVEANSGPEDEDPFEQLHEAEYNTQLEQEREEEERAEGDPFPPQPDPSSDSGDQAG